MPTTINDELLRIEGAKADIATAIGNKGVTVPANAKIDDFADLIAAIQTGGGDSNVLRSLIERSITSIEIPNGITSIGYSIFQNCSNLESVIIPNSVREIDSNAFQGTALQSIVLPEGITRIGQAVFGQCPLVSITIPNSVTSFGTQVFIKCSHLTSVTIGSGVSVLSTQMFIYCSALQEITIPSNITAINPSCFSNTGLAKIILLGNNTALYNTTVFNSTPIANGTGKIYVPYGYGNTYKGMTNWSAYASQIYELDSNGNIPS